MKATIYFLALIIGTLIGIPRIEECRVASALTCYTYDSYFDSDAIYLEQANLVLATFKTLAKLVSGCSACKKTSTQTNMHGIVPLAESWGCDMSPSSSSSSRDPFSPPCKESVHVSYSADGSTDTKSCVCCTEGCNDADFCTDKDHVVSKIKSSLAVTPPSKKQQQQQTTSPLISCYNASVTSSSDEQVETGPFEKTAVLQQNCRECRKTTMSMTFSKENGLTINDDHWECVTHLPEGANCLPQVTGHVYLDGSLSNMQCTCCNSKCNSASFCSLSAITTTTTTTTTTTSTKTKRPPSEEDDGQRSPSQRMMMGDLSQQNDVAEEDESDSPSSNSKNHNNNRGHFNRRASTASTVKKPIPSFVFFSYLLSLLLSVL